MKLPRRAFLPLAAGIAALVSMTTTTLAQGWPTRAVTMVDPSAPGGSGDVLGRILAPRLSELLGRQVIVENIGGAGGMLGVARVAKAAPDGYQFALGNVGNFAQNQTFYKKPLYNAATDFAPVALVAELPLVLITRNDFPASNLKEFAAYAKANEGKLQYASAGPGSGSHLRSSQRGNRNQGHACSLSRRRASNARFDCRPDRLSVPWRGRCDWAH